MIINRVDRTSELEEKLKALLVFSEDTCCFWKKNRNTQITMPRCYYCEYYKPDTDNENKGICTYKGISSQ